MRIGIFGGTFDPVHYGHLLLAETCREQLQLTEVRLMPAGSPPHKPDSKITDGHARADMLALAVSGYPDFVIDRRELRRKGPSFTVDTLQEIQEQFPEAEVFLLIGADSLKDLSTWRQPETILQLSTVVAVNRPGEPALTKEQVAEWVGESFASKIKLLSMPGTDLSATELRARIRDGKQLRFMTPRAVEAFIKQHKIYG